MNGNLATSIKIILVFSLLFFMVICVNAPISQAVDNTEKRTVFVIGDIGDYDVTVPVDAYIIYGDQLIPAETWWIDQPHDGAVGMAVDEINEYLFFSFEYLGADKPGDKGQNDPTAEDSKNKIGDTVYVYSARDGSYIDEITLAGTDNLAGMVVHQARGHLYVVDRNEEFVAVFDNNNNFSFIELWNLPNAGGVYGIDLLGDTLFVSDPGTLWTNDVRWYDIDTHAQLGHITLPQLATGIAVMDNLQNPSDGPMIFTTEFDGGCILDACDQLQRHSVGSGNFQTITVGKYGKGIGLNPPMGIAYVAQGPEPVWSWDPPATVKVLDVYSGQTLYTHYLPRIWNPTDVEASAIPFGGTVSKTCTTHPNGVIQMGQSVTFEIEIENRGSNPLVLIPLNDIYDDTHFSFVSSAPSPDSPTNGDLLWNDLTTVLGDLPAGQTFSITVNLLATDDCSEDLQGSNLAKVEDAQDSVGNSMWAAGVFDYVIECNCATNDDCDDGEFCNGEEYCDIDGSCQAGDPPCPDDGVWCNGDETCNEITDQCVTPTPPCQDDGLYCNGTETCNESGQTCDHSGDPCPDDGAWCNGAESCNETTDQCNTPTPPCSDDSLYCNGTETCNESTDTCDHSGDPCSDDGVWCNGAESCNETTDQCNTPVPPCADDSIYCNGTETCNEGAQTCGHSGDPCTDDNLYCNGSESCNETSDSCDHTGNPCPDDGLYCNGTNECIEATDQCNEIPDPCPDDNQYCNGVESCNEDSDSCDHSGDPCIDDGLYCNGDESCNEDTESCEHSGDPCVDDGLFCNGNEFCSEEIEGCDHSGNPCLEGQICNEDLDICEEESEPTPEPSDDDSPDPAPGGDEVWPEGQVSGGCCGC